MPFQTKSLFRLYTPFVVVSLAALALFVLADQTLDALRVSMRFSDLWMESDRNATHQLIRCIDHGGSECNLVEQNLQKPLAYVRATQERAKAKPDDRIIDQNLQASGIDASPLRFRLEWFEKVGRLAGFVSRNPQQRASQESRVKGEMPPDLSNILQLNLLAKQAWSAKPPDFAALNASRAQSLALLSSLEAAKTVFDRRSADSSLKLRRILYAVVGSTVLAMFAIAAWSSQRMLRRWQRQEAALLEREKQLSADLARSVESLQAAVADKTVLLREVQHRVKNNLAVITALLGIEADRSSDAAVGQSLMSMCDRVRSMALVHDRLSYSETAASIDFAEYVSILSRDLLSSFGADLRAISFHSDVNAVLTLDEAVPCGLILNELLTNSLKHGFPSGSAGNIYLFLREENGEIDLRYHDDGVGLPAQFDITSSPSLGMQIISDLATQLGGGFRREGSTGAAFRITATRRVHHPDAHAGPLVAAV